MLGYTTISGVQQFLNRTFPEVSGTEFNNYISAAETQINQLLGYNSQTTLSGLLSENIVREKARGKIDNFGNLVIDVTKPPIHFDAFGNPMVTLIEFNFGGIRIPLQLTDGSTNTLNTLLEVAESRRKLYYPSLYFYPAISTVTPTAKTNLYRLQDVSFWVDISYTGGYDVIPADIALACNYLIGDMLVHRDNPSFLTAIRQGSYSVSYGNKETQNIVKSLISPYMRVTW